MVKKTSKNNDLLYSAREKSSPKIYEIILDLVNDDREDLAKDVMKIDYLLEYTSNCIKGKGFKEGKETIKKVEERINILKKDGVKVDYLEYLCNGIKKKLK